MKHTLFVRVLTLFLALMMVVGNFPATAFATEPASTETLGDTVAETTAPEIPVPETAVPEITVTEDTAIPEGIALSNVNGFVSETHDVFSHTESVIAPGVTQSINYAYAKDGKQMVYYVLTADVTRDDVVVQTSYKDQYVNKQFGMEKLTVQMAYADKLYTDVTSDRFISEYYKVVGGVNASFYNMTTGQPSGVTYLDGVQIGESSSYAQFFAILKDGTAIIDYTKNVGNYKDNIWQACAGSQMLVWNGKDVTASASGSYNTDRHSRTCVGITADGKVVMMSLDGRQEPFSCGGTMHELAQIMMEQGCVAAINLDGGGSTTFAARQEGENDVTIVNRPSDGSERSISSGLIIGSLAVPSNVFDRATLSAEHDYVTPGSTVAVAAKGVSPAGTAADIPENVTWQLADPSMGTVLDGVFTSSGIAGDAVVQMVYEGDVVGETTIHVVIPEAIAFNSASMTVPYGKSIVLAMTATHGLNEVVLKDGDIVFTLEAPAIGTVDGFLFTAAAEGAEVTVSAVNAKLVFDENVTAVSEIKLGKGSEVIFDFEDGTTGDLLFSEPTGEKYNYVWPESDQGVVTAENGKVHSGTYAMKAWVNYSNSLESGYQKTSLTGLKEAMVFENATRVGMWIYIPDEAVGLWARWTIQGGTKKDDGSYTWAGITGQNLDTTVGGTGVVTQFKESGWHYLSIDTSAYAAVRLSTGALMQFYISDRDGAAYGYDASDYSNIIGNFTFYIDDITVDYSEAVDDREAPVFSSVVYADEFTNDAPELNGQTVTSNKLSFTATVADFAAGNATGLNGDTAKAYIDGKEVDFTYGNGKIAVADAVLADGKHTVKFSVCDNQGNYGYVIREIVVNAGSGMDTVKLVPQDASLNRILHGSIYYMDLVASNIANVNTVSVSIDLDSLSTWQLDHMDVAAGFEASYSVQDDENIATITITRTGDVEAAGEAALVSIPVRVWQLKTGYVYPNGTKQGAQAFTAKQFRDMKEFWRISLIANVDSGMLTTLDGVSSVFTGTRVFVDTEMWAEDADMIATSEGMAYYNSWDGGHVHSAEAVADEAHSCTEDGYTGRTFCSVCNSVVDWGTTVPATGHTFENVDGVLKCACGELFNGELDGIMYVDGVAAQGWFNDSYYVNGVKLTGIQLIDGYYYDLGDDGICAGQAKYTGLIHREEGLSYAKLGELVTGWVLVGEDNYYFGEDYLAVGGTDVRIGYYIYSFDENYVLVKGMWTKDTQGRIRYVWAGVALAKQMREIEGNTYCFDASGYLMTGDQYVKWTHGDPYTMYYITDDGVVLGKMDGFNGMHKSSAGVFMVENGEAVYAGLVRDAEGNYYYINSSRKAVVNTSYSISESKANGLLPAGRYEFGADGKMINPPVVDPDEPDENVKQGLIWDEDGEIRYYVDGVATYAGLVLHEGNYYYINSSKKAVKNTGYNIGAAKTNGLLPAGRYFFDADGKMIDPPVV